MSCGVDAISSFPDEIIALILSFLTTKKAASTTILSTRWRNLFPLMKKLFTSHHVFCLDSSELVYPKEEKLTYIQDQRFNVFASKTLRSNSIKKLSLKFRQDTTLSHYTKCLVFTSQMTLIKLTLEGVEPRYLSKVFLPVLKSLVLHYAQPWYWGKQLCHEMLLGCPILEELFLYHSYIDMFDEVKPFSISHKTLKRLIVSHNGKTLEHGRFISLDTPSLVYLDYSTPGPRLNSTAGFVDSLVQAKLNVKAGGYKDLFEFVNLMRNVKTMALSYTCIDSFTCFEMKNPNYKALPIFLNLVKLSFESNTIEGWEMLPRILNNSPKLETLVLKACIFSHFRPRNFQLMMDSYCKVLHVFSNLIKLSFESNTNKGWKMLPHFLEKSPKLGSLVLKGFHSVKTKRFCDCIDRKKLKVLEIYGFGGSVREFRQVKGLLTTMHFLQLMKVEIIADDKKKSQVINQLVHLPKHPSKCKVSLL